MAQKMNQSKSYVAINIPKESGGRKGIFSKIFKRNVSTTERRPKLNKTEIARLFSLAKPEKWKLLSIKCLF